MEKVLKAIKQILDKYNVDMWIGNIEKQDTKHTQDYDISSTEGDVEEDVADSNEKKAE